eukprot:TRINITY_DN1018_c0_g2_i4.p2 TRINITY_DN1018_c0_g2~~TRINITY_DN1018_c0_g2_i4.p2  ORF type:complete len:251 (+),score=51.20 TRINITY_DN1018_c0_g2_i4:1537-2289(+)
MQESKFGNDPSLGLLKPGDQPKLELSDEDWGWFCQKCTQLHIPVDDSKRGVVTAIFQHLAGVNRWLNLTCITTPREYLKLHFLDSLTLLGDPDMPKIEAGVPCVDIGSGGGYPGLPLAAWLSQAPWTLVDARKKKCDFLAAACTVTGNKAAGSLHMRGSEAPTKAGHLVKRCQMVTCRAMAQSAEVLKESAAFLRPGGYAMLYKGPAFAGDEKQTALAACGRLGYKFIREFRMTLEEGDPERVIAVFQKT